MSVTITKVGIDLKIDEETVINNYPINDITKKVKGDTIEFVLNGVLVKSFKASEFTNPTGTAEEIADKISLL